MSDITEDIFADEIADPCDDCGAAAGVMCDCVLEGIFGPKSGA